MKLKIFLNVFVILCIFIRQSMSQCPSYEYNNNGKCVQCHKSCRECEGGKESDCLSCIKSFQKCPIENTPIFLCQNECSIVRKEVIYINNTKNNGYTPKKENDNQNFIFFVSSLFGVVGVCFILCSIIIIIVWRQKNFKNKIKFGIPEPEILQTSEILPMLESKANSDSLAHTNPNIAVHSELPPRNFVTNSLMLDQKEKLGSGAYGDVYKCPYDNNGKFLYVAVKIAKATSHEAFNEREVMAGLEHPHIIRLIKILIDENIILVMPLRLNNLYSFLRENPRLTITNKIRYLQQIAEGMNYLVFRRISHCDLKASNILVVNENYVEICDFGKARSNNDIKSPRQIGTITHTALELLNSLEYPTIINSESTDVWSYGVLIWEMFDTTMQHPYVEEIPNLTTILLANFLEKGDRLQITKWHHNAPQRMATLMYKCWLRNSATRPKFNYIWAYVSTLLPENSNLSYNFNEKEDSNFTTRSSINVASNRNEA